MLVIVVTRAPEKNASISQDNDTDEEQDVLHDILCWELVKPVGEQLAALFAKATHRFEQNPKDTK